MVKKNDETRAILEPLLSRTEAARILGVKPQTLALWHSTGRYGIPVVMVGRLPKYKPSVLVAWIEQHSTFPAS